MAEVPWIVEEAMRGDGGGVEVDGPVHEGGCAADGEDDGVHGVHGNGFDAHGFSARTPVGGNVSLAFRATRALVNGL